jgi:Zn-finger nucleic acid-binding protein
VKICDRCSSAAVDMIVFDMDDQRYDVCASCRQVVLETLTMKKAEPEQDMKETPSGAKRKQKSG